MFWTRLDAGYYDLIITAILAAGLLAYHGRRWLMSMLWTVRYWWIDRREARKHEKTWNRYFAKGGRW